MNGRIPYLDGLRAYSIVTVVVLHSAMYVPWMGTRSAIPVRVLFGNGSLGVHIFFVLSGFLITTLLLEEMDVTGTVSIARFYQRRLARIFPAFYMFLAVMVALTVAGLTGIDWQALVSAGTFTWNYGSMWSKVTMVDGLMLSHVWTLSIEEQFYLVWPVCLLVLGRRWAEYCAIACVVLFPLSRVDALPWYLLPHGRLLLIKSTESYPILWGAVAAFACKRGLLIGLRKSRYRGVIPWLSGLVLFVACPMLISRVASAETIVVPSIESFAVVCLMLWLLSGEGGWLRKALEFPLTVQLGLLSYSLYLWQQPLITWNRLAFIPLPLRLLGALLAAIVSYRFIEVPARNRIRRWFSQPPVVTRELKQPTL